MNIISIEKIRTLPTYIELKSKKDFIRCGFLEQKSMREGLTNAFEIYKNTGEIPKHFQSIYLKVINDLINLYKLDKGIDASNIMTAETIKLTDNTIIE